MAMRRVVHISDLHIGGSIAGGGRVPRANGHDRRLLEGLLIALTNLRRARAIDALVITGDVTARGGPDEFALYHTIRNRGLESDSSTSFAPLTHGVPGIVEVPGNHDYWNGVVLNPWINAAVRRRHFQTDCEHLLLSTDRYLICLHGACSTSGATRREQFCAVGAFADADRVATEAGIAADTAWSANIGLEPFHLFVTHHSAASGSDVVNGFADRALTWLQGLLAPVQGFLTGHTHTPVVNPRGIVPVEVRCATTTQAWQTLPWSHWPSREFLVHEFADGLARLEWSITPWIWKGTGFQEQPPAAVNY